MTSIPFRLKSSISRCSRPVRGQTNGQSVYSKESKVDDLIGEGAQDVTETLRKVEFGGEYTLRPALGAPSLQTGSNWSSTAATAEEFTWR